MSTTTYSPEAIRALKALFRGVSGTKVSRQRVLKNVSLKTYYNYGPTVYDAGLAEADKLGNRLNYIKLTPAGREVLDNIRAEAQPDEVTMPAMKQEYLLDDITRLVDKFNKLSGVWEWKLVRKEVAERR